MAAQEVSGLCEPASPGVLVVWPPASCVESWMTAQVFRKLFGLMPEVPKRAGKPDELVIRSFTYYLQPHKNLHILDFFQDTNPMECTAKSERF